MRILKTAFILACISSSAFAADTAPAKLKEPTVAELQAQISELKAQLAQSQSMVNTLKWERDNALDSFAMQQGQNAYQTAKAAPSK